MNELSIEIDGEWLGGKAGVDDATFAPLIVRAGGVPLTEVHDTIAQSTRASIRVPAVRVARWLLSEWWRLRWEARPESMTRSWRQAHSMAGLGGGFAWPALEIASDGEFVQLSIAAEREADAAAIRYLRNVTVEVSAREWERGVDRFLDTIQARVATVLPEDHELAELREELAAERNDPRTALLCRREARAGYEPGEAPSGWDESTERLAADVGESALDDVLALTGGGDRALAAVEALRRASTTIDLGAVTGLGAASTLGKPWERGAETARRARAELGVGDGPLTDAKLGEVIGQRFPLRGDATGAGDLLGGYRAADRGGTTSVLLGTPRVTKQRFHMARLIGMAALLPRSEQVLAITPVKTAAQKFGRAFAQELLCPWAEMDAFTDAHGMGESAIAQLAERYQVSEMLVTTTLVNRGKLERDRLDTFVT